MATLTLTSTDASVGDITCDLYEGQLDLPAAITETYQRVGASAISGQIIGRRGTSGEIIMRFFAVDPLGLTVYRQTLSEFQGKTATLFSSDSFYASDLAFIRSVRNRIRGGKVAWNSTTYNAQLESVVTCELI